MSPYRDNAPPTRGASVAPGLPLRRRIQRWFAQYSLEIVLTCIGVCASFGGFVILLEWPFLNRLALLLLIPFGLYLQVMRIVRATPWYR